MRVFLFPDRGFQRNRFLRDLHDLPHPVHTDLHLFGDLVGTWLPSQLLQELTGNADELVDGFHHVYWNANSACLIGDGPCDGLPYPPGGIGTEFIALRIIKFFHGLDEAQITFLNEIEELHAASHIAFRDTDHKAQIRFRQSAGRLFSRRVVSVITQFGQPDLVLRRKKRHPPNLFQVHANWIVNADPFRYAEINLLFRLPPVSLGTFPHIVRDLNPLLGEGIKNILHGLHGQFLLLKCIHHIVVAQNVTVLLPLLHQPIDNLLNGFRQLAVLFAPAGLQSELRLFRLR